VGAKGVALGVLRSLHVRPLHLVPRSVTPRTKGAGALYFHWQPDASGEDQRDVCREDCWARCEISKKNGWRGDGKAASDGARGTNVRRGADSNDCIALGPCVCKRKMS
jgi:hypothetical protein